MKPETKLLRLVTKLEKNRCLSEIEYESMLKLQQEVKVDMAPFFKRLQEIWNNLDKTGDKEKCSYNLGILMNSRNDNYKDAI